MWKSFVSLKMLTTFVLNLTRWPPYIWNTFSSSIHTVLAPATSFNFTFLTRILIGLFVVRCAIWLAIRKHYRPEHVLRKQISIKLQINNIYLLLQVKYVIFGFIFVFCFTSASRKFWATLSVWNTNFLLAAKRQATLDWERPTLCHSFSLKKKSYCNIVRVLLQFLLGREIHLKHRSLYNKFFP